MSSKKLAAAMLLAAGQGARMRPLSSTTPKPLLQVRGLSLLAWHMRTLAQAGHSRVVINTAWLETVLQRHLGAEHMGMTIAYSSEQQDFGRALETAGGIVRALPLLADCFWVAAGDVWAPDFVFDPAALAAFTAEPHVLAHLYLVPNPAHHPSGDFVLSADPSGPRYTFSTIALYRQALFQWPWCAIAMGNPKGIVAPMAPLLRTAIAAGRVRTSLYTGRWADVGTPERLAELNAHASA